MPQSENTSDRTADGGVKKRRNRGGSAYETDVGPRKQNSDDSDGTKTNSLLKALAMSADSTVSHHFIVSPAPVDTDEHGKTIRCNYIGNVFEQDTDKEGAESMKAPEEIIAFVKDRHPGWKGALAFSSTIRDGIYEFYAANTNRQASVYWKEGPIDVAESIATQGFLYLVDGGKETLAGSAVFDDSPTEASRKWWEAQTAARGTDEASKHGLMGVRTRVSNRVKRIPPTSSGL